MMADAGGRSVCLALELFELNALHLHQVTRRSSWGRYT
jgi:hypothetical protein